MTFLNGQPADEPCCDRQLDSFDALGSCVQSGLSSSADTVHGHAPSCAPLPDQPRVASAARPPWPEYSQSRPSVHLRLQARMGVESRPFMFDPIAVGELLDAQASRTDSGSLRPGSRSLLEQVTSRP